MGGDFGQGSGPGRRGWRRIGRLLIAGLALAAHAAVLAALMIGTAPRFQTPFEPPTIPVELAEAQAPRISSVAPDPTPSPAAAPPPSPRLHHPTPAPPDPLLASPGAVDDPQARLSDAQIAGAAAAGSGPGGGRGCDMARRLQAALRKDARVQAAVAEAVGVPAQALFVWNGDWIRSPGQDGAGLAAVREAILWEVGFAPPACRAEPVHGLVLFSMTDGPNAARLVVGAEEWRWSDLLHPRSGRP